MGQEYIGIKGQLSLDDKIYITASEDNTTITSGDNILSTINSGETYELSLPIMLYTFQPLSQLLLYT